MSRRVDLVFPRFKILSGAERLILELAAGLRRAGHRPRVVCHRFDPSCRALLADGVELETTGIRIDWTSNRYLNAAFDYARVGALGRRIDRSVDAVVLYGPALRLAPRLVGWTPPRPAVVYHCFEPPRVLYQDRDDVLSRAGMARWPLRLGLAAYRRLDRRLVRVAEAVTASGPYAAERIRDVYGREATPITHGIARTRLDAPAGPELPPADLITVNYLHPRKRVDRIVRALAALPDDLGDTVLEIVGDGPERAALEALASSLGVGERVRFAGFVDEARLADHYRRASCYVHAAREESFGLSVIEAAYCGLPVVAAAEGGVVDNVVDGETGYLRDASPESLAAGITAVLRRPDRGRALGAAGRVHVDRYYRWERGVEDLITAVDRASAARDRMET